MEAFAMPLLSLDRSPEFAKLMGRIHAEGLMPEIAVRHFRPIVSRFFSAICRALPEMSREELAWKAHCAIGALAHMLLAQPRILIETPCRLSLNAARQLIAFAGSGFRAVAEQQKELEVIS